MLAEESGTIGNFKRSLTFDWGTGPLPHWGPPYPKANTILGGATLWVLRGRKPADYKGVGFHGVLAPHAKLRTQSVASAPLNAHEACDPHAQTSPALAPARMSWACLLKRVFEIDIERCPRCGGRLKIIAAIVDPQVIIQILTHLGFPARAPPRSPARPLPLFQAA